MWTVGIAEDGDRVLGLYPSTGVLDLSIMVTLLLFVGRVCASVPGELSFTSGSVEPES